MMIVGHKSYFVVIARLMKRFPPRPTIMCFEGKDS